MRELTNFLSLSCFSGTSSFKLSRRDCCVHCQNPECCLIHSMQTFVEACLDWNRVPVRAKDLNAELEKRARVDIVRVWKITDRSRRPCILSMCGSSRDIFAGTFTPRVPETSNRADKRQCPGHAGAEGLLGSQIVGPRRVGFVLRCVQYLRSRGSTCSSPSW